MDPVGEHVTGRRLDVNGSNLVLFRGADPKLSYANPKRTNDQDMLDYVRAQEQKLKLEKLKWHENNARIVALQAKPAATAKSTPPQKEPVAAKKVVQPVPIEVKKPTKEKLSPKHVAELVDDRNKRASKWLHQEQKEHQLKKVELLEHKRAAKELDQKRRAAEQMEAERRRQKQLQMLYEDPVVSSILPPVAEFNAAASIGSVPQPQRVSKPVISEVPAPPQAADVRVSYDTVVIQQIAAQLQLHTPPENELLLMHKRPRVPRLSKSFVNRNSLVNSDAEGADSPVKLTKRERVTQAKSDAGSDDGSDGYGDDADFESKDGHKDASAAANSQLVQKVLQNDRYGKQGRDRTTSDQEYEDSDFESHAAPASVAVDRITEQSEAVLQKRREDGRQYAEKRMVVILQKEEEVRRLKALEEKKRRESLSQLKARVQDINKRTKHYSSTASQGSHANSAGTPGGSTIRSLLTPGDERPIHDPTAPRQISSNIADLVLSKYDYMPQPMQDAEDEDAVNLGDNNSDNGDREGDFPPPPRHVQIQSADPRGAERDLRNLDPNQVGGWNRFIELELARAKLQKEEMQGLDATPPRSQSSGRPTSAPSSSQSRNRTSPPMTRPGTAGGAAVGAGSGAGISSSAASQPRRPTPPPFRFNSWQSQQAGAAKRTAAATVETRVPPSRPRTATTSNGQSRLTRSGPVGGGQRRDGARKPATKAHTTKPSKSHHRGERERSASAPRGERPSTARSTSTGAAGMRRSAVGRYDDVEEVPQRHRSAGRSRSVFDNASQDHMLGGDMLDLLERDSLSEGERDYDEEFDGPVPGPFPGSFPGAFPGHTGGAPSGQQGGAGLGGYLSMSPARDFLVNHQQGGVPQRFAPSPAAVAVLQEFSAANRPDPYGSEEQQLMEDVSLQAIQNFEQVNRVLQDVDRWCERAKHETLELQERLRMRESTESVLGHSAGHSTGHAAAPAGSHSVNHSAAPRPPMAYIASPPDEKSIALLRRSLTDKLSMNAPGLFVEADSSRSASSDDSRDQYQQDEDMLQGSRSDSDDSPHQSSDQWRAQLASSRMTTAAAASQARQSQNFDHFRASSDERKASLEDTEDNVLIGETDESGSDNDGAEQPLDYRQHHQYEPPVPAARPQAGTSDLFLLNTNRPDRPIVWAPKDGDHRSAEALSRDPLLAQQLGMTADRNDILAKYSKLDLSASDGGTGGYNADFPTYQAPFAAEDWTKPIHSSAATNGKRNAATELPPYMPSLRNVGELAGLLKSAYRTDLSTEVGRRAMLDGSDDSASDSGGESSSDTEGDYDNFSAVSIQAARMMRAQAEQLKAKELELIARSSVDLSASRNNTSSTSATHSASPAVTKSRNGANQADTQEQSQEESFTWDDLATRPLKFDVNAPPRLSVGDSDVPTDEMLHDYIMNNRYGTDLESPGSEGDGPLAFQRAAGHTAAGAPAGAGASGDASGIAARPQKIRYSGAELRMKMMDELRKQDELFNYTVELAELENANALQSARDLAMQAQQRTAHELSKMQQQKELDMQRLAYENSLALSLVNAQAQMDRVSADQREQMIQMQSQLGVQEMFRRYQELLHQADHVAGSLEHNQKLLQLEKMLHEDRTREAVAHLESQHATERAALVMAHAEAQQAQAVALATATRMSIERHAQGSYSGANASSPRSSRDKSAPSGAGAVTASNRYSQQHLHQQQPDKDSYDEDYEDEYSTQFENDASMSMSMRSRTGGAGASGAALPARRADLRRASRDSEESIPEEEDSGSEPAANQSLSVSDSVQFSPDKSVKQVYRGGQSRLEDSARSVQDSIRSSASSVKRGGRYGASNNKPHEESDASDIEEEEDALDKAVDASQESVFESYEDTFVQPSPPRRTAAEILRASKQQAQQHHSQSLSHSQSIQSQSQSQSYAQSQSQSARDLEISERSASQSHSRGQGNTKPATVQANRARLQDSTHSADFEVSDEIIEDEASVAEEIDEEPADEYSDTFEFSGSKGSKSTSSGSNNAAANKAPTGRSAPVRAAAPAAASSLRSTTVPRASIAALDSSTERDPVFADGGNVEVVLDEYRAEMEQRLRAQEKTYKLKVQFLKAKQIQRLEWLEKVRQNKQISPADIQDEAGRINDTYAEERAEVERERWALNARAYKELRKFKRLRKDLLNYQVNMENSAQAAAELEASLLNLKKKESTLQGSARAEGVDWYHQAKTALGSEDTSDSVTSSSDGAAFAKKLNTVASRASATASAQPARAHPARAQPVKASTGRTQPQSDDFEVESEVEEENEDDLYGGEEFERTFSTAASPSKKAGASKYDVSQSDAYESATFEKSLGASAESVAEARNLGRSQESSASEVPSESEKSFNDSIDEESERSARYHDHSAESEHEAPLHHTAGRSRAESDDMVQTGEAAYEEDAFEDTGAAEESYQPHTTVAAAATPVPAAAAATPVPAAAAAVSSPASAASPEEDYSGYSDDDFVEASDHSRASGGSKGSAQHTPVVSTTTAPKPAAAASTAQAAVHQDEQSVGSDEISEEIEEEIPDSASESGSERGAPRGDQSQLSQGGEDSFVAKSPTRTGGAAVIADVSASADDAGAEIDASQDLSNLQSDHEGEEHSQEHSQEFSQRLDSAAESPTKPAAADQHAASASFLSTGSAGASAKEDEDEVVYADEGFDEYQSDYESEQEKGEPATVSATSSPVPVPSAAAARAAALDKSRDSFVEAAEDSDSVGTDISEDEELAASFAQQQQHGSDSDSDGFVKTSQQAAAAAVVKAGDTSNLAASTGADASVVADADADAHAKVASAPLAVETTQSEAALDAITPMSSGTEHAESRIRSAAEEQELELWGSEDFVESPVVFNRKTSELLFHQSSSDTVFQESQEAEDTKKMFFDPDQQRWVGGEEVSLDGFDESVDAATENDKDLSSSLATPHGQGSSAESSLADRHEFSRDVSFEKEGIAERQDAEFDSGEEFGEGSELNVSSDRHPAPAPVSPVKATVAVTAAAAESPAKDEEDAYESDEFSVGEPEPSPAPAVAPNTAKAAVTAKNEQSDAEDSVEEEIEEVVDDTESSIDADASVDASADTSPLKVLPVPIEANTKTAADLTNLTTLSAVSAMDESEDVNESQLSELLAADLLDKLAKPEDAVQVSEQDTLEGNLTDYSFDYVEPAEPSAVAAPSVAVTDKTTKPAPAAVDEDSFLDLDLSLDDLAGVSAEVSVSSEATEFADLSELAHDYVEDNWTPSVAVAAKPAAAAPAVVDAAKLAPDELLAEQAKAQQQKEQEQENRIVLVVTDTILDALVESECARMMALVPASDTASFLKSRSVGDSSADNRAEQKTSPAKTAKPVKPASPVSPVKETDAELEFAADLLAENMMKKSSKFSAASARETKEPEHDVPQPKYSSLPSALPSAKSSLSSLSSLSALPSLSAKKAPLPSLTESKHEGEYESDTFDDEHEGGKSSLMLPAEFEDEELYEFDIPTNKPAHSAAPLTPHVSSSDNEESQAGAALAASIVAAEAAKGRSQKMLAETKTFVSEILSEPDLNLAQMLGDNNFQGRFVSALEGDEGSVGDVHSAALRDRMNEICQEVFEAKHGATRSSQLATPFEKLTLMRALPLRDDAIAAHITARVLAEQQDLAQVLAVTEDQPEVPVEVRAIDTFRQEAAREIQLASEQMADALLARCLIETIAELGQHYDLTKYFK